ncbi:hypothetical protein SPHINGO391_440238 [Sphingomonas aurantiaca]|uniref:Uncharacterized protein n=1 Tax=Sphingomonas aurantiaca TaxID=185949 RepID=A0A5E7Z6J6_9SPHN|nr:hypothetical protein SPHINGO391_440238 [Sphingomonas aurantiaca]
MHQADAEQDEQSPGVAIREVRAPDAHRSLDRLEAEAEAQGHDREGLAREQRKHRRLDRGVHVRHLPIGAEEFFHVDQEDTGDGKPTQPIDDRYARTGIPFTLHRRLAPLDVGTIYRGLDWAVRGDRPGAI